LEKKLKTIMHVAQSAGGVERYIQMLLEKNNADIYQNILVCSHDYDKKKFEKLTASFEYVDMVREIDFIKDLRAILNVRKLLKKYKPDILYCHSSKAGAVARIASIGIKTHVFYNAHGWAFNMQCSRQKKKVYCLIERILARLTDVIIVISEFERKTALKYKICKKDKLHMIYNGIDVCKYIGNSDNRPQMLRQLNIPTDSYVIGSVGRLSKQKAPDIFVQAAAKIKLKIKNAFFILVGDGEERRYIESLIEKYNLSQCFYITGWVENDIDYINTFNQAMLLSRWEGFGLVLAEYMAAKKPIIATNVDAIPNLIENEKNGLLVGADSINDIVNASVRLYQNKELALSLTSEAEKIVRKKFTIDRVVSQHYELYNLNNF